MTTKKRTGDLLPVGDLAPNLKSQIKALKGLSPIQKRLLDVAAIMIEEPETVLFQHSVFCQTCLPYRDPGEEMRIWERSNGRAHLQVLAGAALDPEEERFVNLGLPFGPKSRMILMHINQRALVAQSPVIEVEDTLTRFVGRVLKLDSGGRTIKTVKDQLARLAAASIRLGIVRDGHATTFDSKIVEAFDIWFPKDERQRVLWPSTVSLSPTYFQNLMLHAVPVDEAHIAALSHSSLGLDIYSWLAQRLHRIPVEKPQTVSWISLHAQFGQGYNPERMYKFRQVFRVALKEVLMVYPAARVEDDEAKPARPQVKGEKMIWREEAVKGLKLFHSAPPVRKLLE